MRHERTENGRHFVVEAHDVLGPAAQSVLAYVASLDPAVLAPGAVVQFGWVRLYVEAGADGALELHAPDLRGDALTQRTSDASLALLGLTELVGFAQRTGIAPGEVHFDDTLIMHRDAIGSGEVYLERLEPTRPGDSGWYIGPAGATEMPAAEDLVLRRVWEILLDLPKVFGALCLPQGALVVATDGEVVSVSDAANTTLWRAERGTPGP